MALVWEILLLLALLDKSYGDFSSSTLGIPCDEFDGDGSVYAKLIFRTSMHGIYVYGTEWGHYYACPDCVYKPLSLSPISNVFGSTLCVYLDGDPRYLIAVSQEKPYSGCDDTNTIMTNGNSTSECVWNPSKWVISPLSNRFYPTGHYSIFIKGKDDIQKTTIKEPMKKYPFYIVPAVFVLGCTFGFMYWRHRKKSQEQWITDEDRLELAPLKDV